MIASARPFPQRGRVQGVQGGRRPPAHRRRVGAEAEDNPLHPANA